MNKILIKTKNQDPLPFPSPPLPLPTVFPFHIKHKSGRIIDQDKNQALLDITE